MVSRIGLSLLGIFSTFSGLASDSYPNTNTVPIANGQRAALVAVRNMEWDHLTKSSRALIVLDARDRYGTLTRINTTATINPAKLKGFVKQCLRGNLGCFAAIAITELLIQYGATVQPDGTVVLPGGGSGAAYPGCVWKNMPMNAEGGIVQAFGPIPCAIAHPNGNADFYSFDQVPQKPIDTPQKMNGWVFGTAAFPENKIYYRNPYFANRPEPLPKPAPKELTDDQMEEAILKTPRPESLQHSPGKYPDIFDPIPVPDAAKDSDIGTTPKDPDGPKDPSDPNTDTEPPAEMIDLSQIPTFNIDVTQYLDEGSGWLPKECPPPVNIPIFARSIDWEYTLMCDVTSRYVSALVMIGAVFFFLRIVVGGLDRG